MNLAPLYITTTGTAKHAAAVLKPAHTIVVAPIIDWSNRERLYSQSTTGRIQEVLAIERDEDGLVGGDWQNP